MNRRLVLGFLVLLGSAVGIALRDLWVYVQGMGNDPNGKLNAYLRNEAPLTLAFLAAGVAAALLTYGLIGLYKKAWKEKSTKAAGKR